MNIPTGNITFLFSDIEGTAKLSQKHPQIIPAIFEKRNSVLTKAAESNNGFVFEIVGDEICCSFENPVDAVKAAVEAQINMTNLDWEAASVKIRIGIHSGKAEWNGSKYLGYITLARTARVMSSSYGEQIVISNDTYEFVKDKFAAESEFNISFIDLGVRRLKDVLEPIRLFQIKADGIPEEFPPLKTLDARPNNLPVQLTSFIGREEGIKKVKELLSDTRLLTLTGSGGTGKTRFALQAGADIVDFFANGVWFVELAAISDPVFLPVSLMNSFSLKEQSQRMTEEVLTEYLKDKEILIILDNCEHLIEACAQLTERLLSSCPKLKILATSREPLKIQGEQTYRVPPLSKPNQDEAISPEQLTQFESVRLFIERALAVNPKFKVNNENAPTLAGICSRLDGVPLALELAAAKTNVLSIEKIYERLDDRFRLLTGGKRTALPRQQTLKALIEWSYELLSETEKILWSRLSVFSGGWTIEAAEEVCPDENIDAGEILDLLDNLTEKSIIIFNEKKERFLMLETIRQYGKDKLKESNEDEKFSEKHLLFYLKMVEAGSKKIRSSETELRLQILDSEIRNIEKSLKWSIEKNKITYSLRIAAAMGIYWQIRGFISDGIHWLTAVLKKNPDPKNPEYCKIICQMGYFSRLKGDVDTARSFLDESLQIRREIGDKAGMTDSLIRLGVLEYDLGRYEKSAEYYEEALKINRELGNKSRIAIILNNLGNVLSNQGNYSRAAALYEESLAVRRESGDKIGMAVCLNNLGIIACEKGEYVKAKELLEESFELRNQVGDKDGIAITLINLGNVSFNQGEYENARKSYKKSLDISSEMGNKSCTVDSLYALGRVSIETGDSEKALDYFNESLLISKEIKAESQIAISFVGLGKTAFSKKEYELARKHYCESVGLFSEAGNNKDIVSALLGMVEVYLTDEMYVPAVKLLGYIDKNYLELNQVKLPLADQIVFNDSISALKRSLGPEEFSVYFDEGKRMTLDEACRLMVLESHGNKH